MTQVEPINMFRLTSSRDWPRGRHVTWAWPMADSGKKLGRGVGGWVQGAGAPSLPARGKLRGVLVTPG